MSKIYWIFQKTISKLVFEISQLPENIEIKVKTVSGSPAHADYYSGFFRRYKLDLYLGKECRGVMYF